MKSISVVIPALNEKKSIAQTVEQVHQTLSACDDLDKFEVIVVDDGSDDGTGDLAQKSGAVIVRHPHNLGYGRSLKDGIKHAQFDTIAITDSDGTYPIDRIPDLVREFENGYDMVVGSRTGKHYKETFIKWPLRLILRFLVEWSTGRKIPDINSGLRVFSRDTILQYVDHLSDSFSFTTSSTLAYMLTSRFVKYMPISYERRTGSSHVRLVRDSLRTLQYITQSINYYNPIKLFLLLSIFCLLIGAACIFAAITLSSPYFWFGAVASAVGAIVIFALGLLADLLRQIMARN